MGLDDKTAALAAQASVAFLHQFNSLIYKGNKILTILLFVIKLSSIWASVIGDGIQCTQSSMNETPKHSKKDRKDFAFGISFGEFVTSVLLGVGSGLATAAKAANDLFLDDTKNASSFQQHFESRARRLDAIDLQDMLAAGKTKADYQRAIHQEKKLLHAEFNEIAEFRRGVSRNPIIGTIDKFKLLGKNSKHKLYFQGAMGAVVGSAVTLGFFNGVATRDKIERIEDAVGADPSQQSR